MTAATKLYAFTALIALIQFSKPANAFSTQASRRRCIERKRPALPAPFPLVVLSKRFPSKSTFSLQQRQSEQDEVGDKVVSSLPPSSSTTPDDDDDDDDENDDVANVEQLASSLSSTVAVMMSQETRRILIEELGYRRKDVDRMRVELAAPIIAKRLPCPETGMPDSWYRSEDEADDNDPLLQKLQNESKYPLKFPLLGVSLILFGKGFSDLLITIIKVNIDFPGASWSATLQGVPVVLIDAICVMTGVALGYWTWNSMRDKP